jgi:hypothetical protein
MNLDNNKMTIFLSFPIEETEKVIKAMDKAEKEADLKALQWAARWIKWLYDEVSETERGDGENYPAHLFNRDWETQLKEDPPPKSIKDIITRNTEGEPPEVLNQEKEIA